MDSDKSNEKTTGDTVRVLRLGQDYGRTGLVPAVHDVPYLPVAVVDEQTNALIGDYDHHELELAEPAPSTAGEPE